MGATALLLHTTRLYLRKPKDCNGSRWLMARRLGIFIFVVFLFWLDQLAGSRSTTAAISSSVYILKPLSLVTLASCTFLWSSFSSITCLSVLRTNVSASSSVRDYIAAGVRQEMPKECGYGAY